MTAQSCRTCDYFTIEDDASYGYPYGYCWWASRHPVPSCYPGCEFETGADGGGACPCWRTKGYIEAFMAEARARRQQEQSQ